MRLGAKSSQPRDDRRRSSQPPRLATWMLKHCGCSPNNDAVLGDLGEKFRHGCSSVWYCRQVSIAIAEGFVTEIRLHKALILRGLLIGTAFQILLVYSINFVIN